MLKYPSNIIYRSSCYF